MTTIFRTLPALYLTQAHPGSSVKNWILCKMNPLEICFEFVLCSIEKNSFLKISSIKRHILHFLYKCI